MEEKHLTEEQIAYAAEMQAAGNYNQLPSEIKTHLAECDLCANEVLMVNEFIEKDDKKKFSSKTYKFIGVIAVAASVLIFISLNYIIDKKPTLEKKTYTENISTKEEFNSEKEIEKELDSSKSHKATKEKKETLQKVIRQPKKQSVNKQAQSKKTVYAQAFNKNPRLEKLAQRSQNASMRSNDELEIVHNINYPEHKTVSIGLEKKQPLVIEIYSNKNKLLKEINTDSLKITLPPLDTGLYYWKILNEDFDLLFVGRIKAFEPEK